MTTNVRPSENRESQQFFELYCRIMGELDKLAELASFHEVFPHNDEIFNPDRDRMQYLFHGLIGLLDQSWRVEDGSFWREYRGSEAGTLMGRLLEYGKVCYEEYKGLSEVRYAAAHDSGFPPKKAE